MCTGENTHGNCIADSFTFRKPVIAHRDIKSRNVLVKNDGHSACIADFGLAVKKSRLLLALLSRHKISNFYYSNGGIELLPKEKFNLQVGTRRYMPPEILDGSLNWHDFEAFKMADIYSWALVLWEIVRRAQV